MEYKKPAVVELNAVTAAGKYRACMSGTTVPNLGCSPGSNDSACYDGTDGYQTADDCISGTTPLNNASCLSGGTTGWECAVGTSPTYGGTCTVGTSLV